MIQKRYRLNSLAQPHLIRQNHIPILVPGYDEPVQTVQLVVSEEFVVFEDWWGALGVLWDGLFAVEDVVEVEFVAEVGQGARVVLLVGLVGEQGFVSFVVVCHLHSGLFVEGAVECSELGDFGVVVAN